MKNREFKFVYKFCVTNVQLGNKSGGLNMLAHSVARFKKL